METFISVVIIIIAFIIAVACFGGLFFAWLWTMGPILNKDKYTWKQKHILAKFSMKLVNLFYRVKIVVHGRENIPTDLDYVVVGNHQSMYDIIVTIDSFKGPIAFIAKDELDIPFLRAWMPTMGCIYIKRDNLKQSLDLMRTVGVNNVKSGLPMAVFPEGTRNYGKAMHPFKPGSFSLATQAEAAILPITIYNTYEVMQNWPLKRTVVHYFIHEPILPEAYSKMKLRDLAEEVQAIIQHQLDQPLPNNKK